MRLKLIEILFNYRQERIDSAEELTEALARFYEEPAFELWLKAESGPAMSMLRNDENAFLMYLRFEGDAGFTSRGEWSTEETTLFRLSNGQVDQYPLSWCLDLETCRRAIASFFTNRGVKPDFIRWHED